MAVFRRSLNHTPLHNIIFIDETALRISDGGTCTLVVPGKQPLIVVNDSTRYAARFDMIASVCYDRVLPPMILSPYERKQRNVDGFTKEIILEYISSMLAQAIGAVDRYPMVVVCDRSKVHNGEEMKNEFHMTGCQDVQRVALIPAKGAIRVSPLDNGLFGIWKTKCRKQGLINLTNIKHVMVSCWESITAEQVQACYRHCALSRHSNPYVDCPAPADHQH